jgi:hypothetical protein
LGLLRGRHAGDGAVCAAGALIVNDFEVMPSGSSRVLKQALRQLERGFAGPREAVAWRFRTISVEHSAWRLTDDASLVEQMRRLGHWDIRPLGELADPAPQAAAAQEAR